MDQKVKALIHSIGLNNNLTDRVVKEIIESPYKFIQEKITRIKLRELSDEEVDVIPANFLLTRLGKLYLNRRMVKKVNYYRKLKEENGRTS